MCQPIFFGDDHDGTSFEAVFGFHVNNHGNRLRPLFFCLIVAFGVTRGCLLVGRVPRFHRSLEPVHQTWTLFSASSFDRNFRPNNNQTFIVYVKSTLVLYRKGLCGFFPVLGFALEEKLRGAKCCKYYGPEGVHAENYLAKIMARLSNCQDSGCDPHQCGTSQSKFYAPGTPR